MVLLGAQVFLKYHHTDELQVAVRKHAEALTFVRKVCKGFIARHRFKALVSAKESTVDAVANLLTRAEVMVMMVVVVVVL